MRSIGRLGGQEVVKQAWLFRHSMSSKPFLSERLSPCPLCLCGELYFSKS
jgi:hypothetical protein